MRPVLAVLLLVGGSIFACTQAVPMPKTPLVKTAEGRTCLQTCQGLYNQCTAAVLPGPGFGCGVNACKENLSGCYVSCPE